MISFSEIETTSKRASKAAGFSWGIAEEIGKSIKSLELFGLPGVINLNLYLKKIKKKHPKKIEKIEKENKAEDKELCPIYSGVAFLDRSMELEGLQSLKFYNVSYPLLMLPFVSRASEIMSKKILMQYDNASFLLNFDKSVFSKNIDKQAQALTKELNIELVENKNSFLEQDWKELYKLSEETFVEESDSSKSKAAGAGLTDND
jgi:hypothetical protein